MKKYSFLVVTCLLLVSVFMVCKTIKAEEGMQFGQKHYFKHSFEFTTEPYHPSYSDSFVKNSYDLDFDFYIDKTEDGSYGPFGAEYGVEGEITGTITTYALCNQDQRFYSKKSEWNSNGCDCCKMDGAQYADGSWFQIPYSSYVDVVTLEGPIWRGGFTEPNEKYCEYFVSACDEYPFGRVSLEVESSVGSMDFRGIMASAKQDGLAFEINTGPSTGAKEDLRTKEFIVKRQGSQITCSNLEAVVDGKCKKISEICGNDSNMNYDEETGECFCDDGYKKEEESCKEIKSINLEIKVIEGQLTPPLLADGKTNTKFLIKGTYPDDDSLANLRFEIGYTRTEKKGNINVSGDKNGYIVEYQTTDLGEVEGQPADYLYIWYYDKNKEKEERDNYEILLFTAMASPITVEKIGMKPLETAILFEAKKSNVFVYYLEDGIKYPIANARIKYEDYEEAITDEQGKAEIKTSQKIYGEEVKTVELEMKLDGRLVTMQTEGKRHYEELKASEQGILDFLNDFPKEIAKANNKSSEEQVKAGAFAVGYSLAIMNNSQVLSKDSSANIARVIADTLNDLLDMTKAVEKFTKFITKPLDNLGDQALDISPEEFKQLYNKIVKLPLKYIESMWGKLRYVVLERIPFLNPRIIDFLYDELLADYVDDLGSIPTLEEMKEGKVTEAQEYLKEKIESFLKEFSAEEMTKKALDKYYQERVNELLSLTKQKIDAGNLSLDLVQAHIEIARDDYVSFADKYLGQTALQYNIDMFRAYADLIKGLVLESIDKVTLFTAPQFYTAVSKTTKAIKESYDKFDTIVLNNTELITWFLVLGKNTSMMEGAVTDLMQFPLAKQEENSSMIVLAAEPEDYQAQDELQIMYDNQVTADNPDREIVFDYVSNKDELDLYDGLLSIMKIVTKGDPENVEAKELLAEIDQKVETLGAKVETMKGQVSDLAILKVKEPELKGEDETEGDDKGHITYYVIIAVIIIVGGVSFWQKDRLKGLITKKESNKIS